MIDTSLIERCARALHEVERSHLGPKRPRPWKFLPAELKEAKLGECEQVLRRQTPPLHEVPERQRAKVRLQTEIVRAVARASGVNCCGLRVHRVLFEDLLIYHYSEPGFDPNDGYFMDWFNRKKLRGAKLRGGLDISVDVSGVDASFVLRIYGLKPSRDTSLDTWEPAVIETDRTYVDGIGQAILRPQYDFIAREGMQIEILGGWTGGLG